MSFASFRLGRLAPLVLPASLALGLAFGCSLESAPEDEDEDGGSSGTGGATAGSGGTAAGGNGGVGGSAGSPTGGVGGVSGAGGASGGVGGVGGTTGGAGGTAGMSVGGTAGMAGQLGGAGSAGAPGGTGGTLGGDAGMGAQGGAGAAAGDSGAGGTTAGSAGSGGTPPMGFLIEDFESGTNGQAPAGWDTFIAWNKNGQNPSGGAQALVDSTRAHSGTKSVYFIGGQNPAQITRPLPSGTNKLYVRAWFYMTRQLGMNPNANHETLIGIRKLTGGANDEVRFGEIKGVIGTNEVPTDNISPKMDRWGMGPVVSANTWHCFEVAFLADGAQHTLHGWVDGTLVHEITAGDQWQNGTMPATWLDGKFVEVVLGWHSFSSANNEVWMDDLVLSNAPIGC